MALTLVALALMAGCDDDASEPAPAPEPQVEQGLRSPEGVMIRDWLMAVQRGDYAQAASFFVRGAIIDQGRPFRLRDAAAARLFNAGLPCYAVLLELASARGLELTERRAARAVASGRGGELRRRLERA